MRSDQSLSAEIEVLPSPNEFERAIEAISGDSSKSVPEEQLRVEIVANHHSLSESVKKSREAVQINEAVERGLLQRDKSGNLFRPEDSADMSWVSETRIL